MTPNNLFRLCLLGGFPRSNSSRKKKFWRPSHVGTCSYDLWGLSYPFHSEMTFLSAFFSSAGYRRGKIRFKKRIRRIRRGRRIIRFTFGRRKFRIGRLTSRVKLYFRRRWYRPRRRGRRWFVRIGRRTCRVIQRGRGWMLRFGKRWVTTRKFMIRVRRRYRKVTRRGRRFYIKFKGRGVRFTFRHLRFFKYRGKSIKVRRVRRGRRRFFKFRFKGLLSKRRIRYRKRRRLRRKFNKWTSVFYVSVLLLIVNCVNNIAKMVPQ